MQQRTALITGITGQDGSYLAEFLLEKGYAVHGLVRRTSTSHTERLHRAKALAAERGLLLKLHMGDMTDATSLQRVVRLVQPDEVYHLAAQTHVGVSFEQPIYTYDVNATGTLRLLEAVRTHAPEARFYQASTSELFGQVATVPQNEDTAFRPQSPYGISKLAAHWAVRNYRDAYGLHASSGIVFNHESPRRGEQFVTRKISLHMARIAMGSKTPLRLGNLDAKRDWGYAPDVVDAMWRMLQQDTPEDLVIATGETHSVREFAQEAAQTIGMKMAWEGSGAHEVGRNAATGDVVVEVDPTFFRPAEVDLLVGDAARARRVLGWEPSVTFHGLVQTMMQADLGQVRRPADAVHASAEKKWHAQRDSNPQPSDPKSDALSS